MIRYSIGVLVHFFEISGSHAKATLQSLQNELNHDKVISTEILQNLEQPALFLLVVRSDKELTIAPQGTRVWKFETLEDD